MSSNGLNDPRRPDKVKRYIPPPSDAPMDDATPDYMYEHWVLWMAWDWIRIRWFNSIIKAFILTTFIIELQYVHLYIIVKIFSYFSKKTACGNFDSYGWIPPALSIISSRAVSFSQEFAGHDFCHLWPDDEDQVGCLDRHFLLGHRLRQFKSFRRS